MVVLLQEMKAVGDHNDVRISRVHLIQSVHAVRVGIVIQNEEEYNGFFLVAWFAVDQGNRAMLHLGSSHRLSVNVVELFDLECCLSGDGHTFSLA